MYYSKQKNDIAIGTWPTPEEPSYHFRNLVFEGGGVKGIAYVGAMKVLEDKRILAEIKRAGGTSAGAINATLFALGYTYAEQRKLQLVVEVAS